MAYDPALDQQRLAQALTAMQQRRQLDTRQTEIDRQRARADALREKAYEPRGGGWPAALSGLLAIYGANRLRGQAREAQRPLDTELAANQRTLDEYKLKKALGKEQREETRKDTKEQLDIYKATEGYAVDRERIDAMKQRTRAMKEVAEMRAKKAKGSKSPSSFGRPSDKQQREIESFGIAKQAVEKTIADFDPDFANVSGVPLVGTTENWIAQNIPLIASDDVKAQEAWWKAYNLIYTLPERHEMFGSALTDTERAAWRDASITPNLQPDQVRKHLDLLLTLKRTAESRMRKNAMLKGWDQAWIDANLGTGGDPTAPQAGLSPAPLGGPTSASSQAPQASPLELEEHRLQEMLRAGEGL